MMKYIVMVHCSLLFLCLPTGCVRRIQWSSLLPGLPVYPVDLTDGQWREFRSSLPLLSLAMFGSFALGRIYNMYLNATGKKDRGGRVYVDLLYGVALVLLQHGRHSLIVFVLLALSYLVGKLTKGTRARVGVAWAFGIFTIALKESYRVKRTYPVSLYRNMTYDIGYSFLLTVLVLGIECTVRSAIRGDV